MNTAIGILVVIVLIGGGVLLSKRSDKKRLNDTWNGTVTKKWLATYTDEDGDVTRTPTIQVQIDGGKKKKLAVSAATYNDLAEGDKLKKVVGQKDPVKA